MIVPEKDWYNPVKELLCVFKVWYNWDEQRSPFGLPIRGERDVLEGEVRALQDRVKELQEETGGRGYISQDQGYGQGRDSRGQGYSPGQDSGGQGYYSQGRHSVDGQRQWSSPAVEQEWDRGSSSRGASTSFGRSESRQGYLEEEVQVQREAEWGRNLPARNPEANIRSQNRGVHRSGIITIVPQYLVSYPSR